MILSATAGSLSEPARRRNVRDDGVLEPQGECQGCERWEMRHGGSRIRQGQGTASLNPGVRALVAFAWPGQAYVRDLSVLRLRVPALRRATMQPGWRLPCCAPAVRLARHERVTRKSLRMLAALVGELGPVTCLHHFPLRARGAPSGQPSEACECSAGK